jgi:hypothetical protein
MVIGRQDGQSATIVRVLPGMLELRDLVKIRKEGGVEIRSCFNSMSEPKGASFPRSRSRPPSERTTTLPNEMRGMPIFDLCLVEPTAESILPV